MNTLWKQITSETTRSTKYNYFIRHTGSAHHCAICQPPEQIKAKWMTLLHIRHIHTKELVEPSTHEDKSYYDPSKRREPLTHHKAIIWKWQDTNCIHWNPETTDELLRIRYRNVDIHKMCEISWRAEQPSASQYILLSLSNHSTTAPHSSTKHCTSLATNSVVKNVKSRRHVNWLRFNPLRYTWRPTPGSVPDKVHVNEMIFS